VIKNIIVAFLLLHSFHLTAQKNKKEDAHLLTDNIEWFEGSIMLNTGEELKGLVKYNDRNGVLSYQNGNDSRVFTALRYPPSNFLMKVYKSNVCFTHSSMKIQKRMLSDHSSLKR
jgi:hypothetical protein